jgi:hypothetical protein
MTFQTAYYSYTTRIPLPGVQSCISAPALVLPVYNRGIRFSCELPASLLKWGVPKWSERVTIMLIVGWVIMLCCYANSGCFTENGVWVPPRYTFCKTVTWTQRRHRRQKSRNEILTGQATPIVALRNFRATPLKPSKRYITPRCGCEGG